MMSEYHQTNNMLNRDVANIAMALFDRAKGGLMDALKECERPEGGESVSCPLCPARPVRLATDIVQRPIEDLQPKTFADMERAMLCELQRDTTAPNLLERVSRSWSRERYTCSIDLSPEPQRHSGASNQEDPGGQRGQGRQGGRTRLKQ